MKTAIIVHMLRLFCCSLQNLSDRHASHTRTYLSLSPYLNACLYILYLFTGSPPRLSASRQPGRLRHQRRHPPQGERQQRQAHGCRPGTYQLHTKHVKEIAALSPLLNNAIFFSCFFVSSTDAKLLLLTLITGDQP